MMRISNRKISNYRSSDSKIETEERITETNDIMDLANDSSEEEEDKGTVENFEEIKIPSNSGIISALVLMRNI